MLLEAPGSVENRCGWLWSLAATCGLLALAVFVSGIGLRADAADEKKDVVVPVHVLDGVVNAEVVFITDDDGDKKVYVITSKDGKVVTKLLVDGFKQEKKDGQPGALPKVTLPDVEEIIKKLPKGLSEEQLKQIRDQMKKANEEIRKANEDIRKAMEQLHKRYPQVEGLKHGQSDVRKAIEDLKAHIEKDVKSDVRKADLEKALEAYRKVLGEQANKVRVWDVQGKSALPALQGRLATLGVSGQGRLGLRVDKPSDTLAEQLELPKGQGLVITDVVADSAAAKAGFKPNDILLEFAGKKVPNDADALIGMVNELKANAPVDAVVLRKGKRETVKGITVAEATLGRTLRLQGPGKIEVRPRIALPGVPGQPGARIEVQPVPGGKSVIMTINRSNDNFTAKHQEGDVTVSVAGTVEGGKAKASAIEVQEGGKTTKFDSVDKVPEQHRDKVKNLIESAGKGGGQIEIRKAGTRSVPATPATPPTPAKPETPKKPAGRDVLIDLPDPTVPFHWLFRAVNAQDPNQAVQPVFVDPIGAKDLREATRLHWPVYFRLPAQVNPQK